jgi:hypothetical protein
VTGSISGNSRCNETSYLLHQLLHLLLSIVGILGAALNGAQQVVSRGPNLLHQRPLPLEEGTELINRPGSRHKVNASSITLWFHIQQLDEVQLRQVLHVRTAAGAGVDAGHLNQADGAVDVLGDPSGTGLGNLIAAREQGTWM